MLYLELFYSFFQIGLFTIGGGYAAIPLIQHQIVNVHQWLTLSEFTDLITIAEMTPGPIAINAATFVGTQIGGLRGAIISTIGSVLPSCIIVLTLAFIYYKYKNLTFIQGLLNGMRPAVVALIASAGLSIFTLALWGGKKISLNPSDINAVAVCLFTFCLFILRKFKPNPIYIITGSGIAGIFIYLLG